MPLHVCVEIPLFHVMSAKVTFGNLNGCSSAVPHVIMTKIREEVEPSAVTTPTASSPGSEKRIRFRGSIESSVDKPVQPTLCFVEDVQTSRLDAPLCYDLLFCCHCCCFCQYYVAYETQESVKCLFVIILFREVEKCEISEDCFMVPAGYRRLHSGGRGMVDQEEELLQMAIQQSLMDQERQGQQQLALEAAGGSEDDRVKSKEGEVCVCVCARACTFSTFYIDIFPVPCLHLYIEAESTRSIEGQRLK